MNQQLILVADDDPKIRQMLRHNLVSEGFRVITAENGRDALLIARDARPNLIILDLMMPELDGYGFIKEYRRSGAAPIILLTAKVAETDQVLGLELGADDYVTKPFSMRILLARIRARLRPTELNGSKAAAPVIRVDHLELDPNMRVLKKGGDPVELTRYEYEILTILMMRRGAILSRLDIIESMKGDTLAGNERSIDVHIRNLRRKIEPDASQPLYIETVYGMGYRFAAN